MDRLGAALFRCTLFPSLIKLKSGKVVPVTSCLFFFGKEMGGHSSSNQVLLFGLASLSNSSVDILVGFNRVFILQKLAK